MVPVQRRGREESARVEPRTVGSAPDLATQPAQPDDQLAVHQADEFEQHGGPGSRADVFGSHTPGKLETSLPTVFEAWRAGVRPLEGFTVTPVKCGYLTPAV